MAQRRRHKRTESQAVTELENVFKSVDLEGEGKLDYASFQTAMYSLDIMVDDQKMQNLFDSVDGATEDGYVNYEDFLKLLKKGKLQDNKAAQEIMDTAKSVPASALGPAAASIPKPEKIAPKAAPKKVKMDPKKKSVIQRAVIVIKKAAMKNISREEVVEFLKDKGLKNDDINYAYEKAQEQAMSPEERIRYLKTQISTKEKELKEQKAFSRHLSEQVSEKNQQISSLQGLCDKAAQQLLAFNASAGDKEKKKVECPDEVLKEIRNYVQKINDSVKGLSQSQKAIFEKDIDKLKRVEAAAVGGYHFVAHLILQSLEAHEVSTMRKTQAFFSEFDG